MFGITDKIDNNIHLKRPFTFTSQILLFGLNNASPWCSGVWLRNNASRCLVSGVRIFSFEGGSLSQTGMLLPTFFGRTYDRKLSIIWLVISCFICLVCWGSKVLSGRLDKAASAPCFCICCQNWLSARPWRTEDSVLYFQGFGSLVAEYSLLHVVYWVASLPWEVGKEINTLPLVVSFDNLEEQAVYLLSFPWTLNDLDCALRFTVWALKVWCESLAVFYAIFSLALVQILIYMPRKV